MIGFLSYPKNERGDLILFDNGEQSDDSVWSDRLHQWDSKKHDRFCKKHFGNTGQWWSMRNPKKIEAFLSDYIGKEIKLNKILENEASDGYSRWVFFFSYQ